jgi:5-methylcytosine-specific restriction endonuclease McrA
MLREWDGRIASAVRARLCVDARCVYCGYAFGRDESPDMDHVIPMALGGTGELWNLAPACASCNRSKGGRLPEDAGLRRVL